MAPLTFVAVVVVVAAAAVVVAISENINKLVWSFST
jgi:hypothetical protein